MRYKTLNNRYISELCASKKLINLHYKTAVDTLQIYHKLWFFKLLLVKNNDNN